MYLPSHYHSTVFLLLQIGIYITGNHVSCLCFRNPVHAFFLDNSRTSPKIQSIHLKIPATDGTAIIRSADLL